jgi:hypothetical protein
MMSFKLFFNWFSIWEKTLVRITLTTKDDNTNLQ